MKRPCPHGRGPSAVGPSTPTIGSPKRFALKPEFRCVQFSGQFDHTRPGFLTRSHRAAQLWRGLTWPCQYCPHLLDVGSGVLL